MPSTQQKTQRCCINPAAPLFYLCRDSLETASVLLL